QNTKATRAASTRPLMTRRAIRYASSDIRHCRKAGADGGEYVDGEREVGVAMTPSIVASPPHVGLSGPGGGRCYRLPVARSSAWERPTCSPSLSHQRVSQREQECIVTRRSLSVIPISTRRAVRQFGHVIAASPSAPLVP